MGVGGSPYTWVWNVRCIAARTNLTEHAQLLPSAYYCTRWRYMQLALPHVTLPTTHIVIALKLQFKLCKWRVSADSSAALNWKCINKESDHVCGFQSWKYPFSITSLHIWGAIQMFLKFECSLPSGIELCASIHFVCLLTLCWCCFVIGASF
jgi:hypothetical protein